MVDRRSLLALVVVGEVVEMAVLGFLGVEGTIDMEKCGGSISPGSSCTLKRVMARLSGFLPDHPTGWAS